MSQIRITPEELREASKFLGDRKEAINNEVSQLKSKIDETTGNWEGAAQSSFVASFNDLYSPTLCQTLPEIIEGIMQQLDVAANTLEEADSQIAAAFK